MTVRRKIALELGILAAFTAVFLALFPRRNPATDLGLAALALLAIAATARYTRDVIWATAPPPIQENQFLRSAAITFWITAPAALMFLVVGAILAHQKGAWPAFFERILSWKTLAAFLGYIVWALMQQTLLQFYLLGRLIALFPARHRVVPILLTGACFGLVHLPDLATASVTVLSGTVWSYLYYRYRQLLPLALSHAVLGLVFHYAILGHDLAAGWIANRP